LDAHDTVPGVNYRACGAARFETRAEAEAVAAQIAEWVPTVEEG
jgi:S-ribosylhomocysteine lyase LuxS involved in autoinducer biosynthesis